MGKFSISDKERLLHIVSACSKIETYCLGKSCEEFLAEDMFQSAVLHQFIIIGEAITHTDASILAKYAYPWHLPRSFRNYIAHEYFGVNLNLVWNTTVIEVPKLKDLVLEILRVEFKIVTT